ncbi:uncharacterized protein LOC123924016 isoform X2 [Trifolium pratense]|uniref:Uncharacterized protein n=1 Tax=Trifolium pratense TaxID=57577 RepID=A0ACB0KE52_TRIPR|nr:uncharacterized protein LOC123924016 isoform X2 [Trifolium pratense]CAJ2654778.1 unnamed protein product [Trifolium pratense]
MAPPATFPQPQGKIQTITLPEDVYVNRFYKKYPESKYNDPIKFSAIDPPPSRIFGLRVLDLKEQGIGEEEAMDVAEMEYLADKKAKKKAYARLKQIARLQGKRLPPNPYPCPIKEIQAEEKKYVRERFFDPEILEIVKQKKEEKQQRFGGGNW